MTPKYAVGEEVILCSGSFPQYNGDGYSVLAFIPYGEAMTCRLTGREIFWPGEGYLLNVPFSFFGMNEMLVEPSELRKKHKPADESYTQMIDRLNRETV